MSLIGGLSKIKPMQRVVNAYRKNPARAIAIAAITSVAVKDGVGCAMYVTQSLNNKKIPDDKRKFVAALDLTNGVLMIAAQIGMFFGMRAINKKLFNSWFSSSFSKNAKKTIATQWRMLQKKAGKVPDRKHDIYKKLNKYENNALNIFSFVSELAAATIIGKRVIVPLIATPLASKLKAKWDIADAKKGGAKPTEQQPTQEEQKQENAPAQIDELEETNLLERYKKYNNVA